MVPGAETFFEEARAAFAEVAGRLGLDGPGEQQADRHLAVVTYAGAGVRYKVVLGLWAGDVEIQVCCATPDSECKVGIEKLAIAAGIAGRPGTVRFGARSVRQLRKSLAGQVRWVELVHPLVSVELMRAAGAREWSRPALK